MKSAAAILVNPDFCQKMMPSTKQGQGRALANMGDNGKSPAQKLVEGYLLFL